MSTQPVEDATSESTLFAVAVRYLTGIELLGEVGVAPADSIKQLRSLLQTEAAQLYVAGWQEGQRLADGGARQPHEKEYGIGTIYTQGVLDGYKDTL